MEKVKTLDHRTAFHSCSASGPRVIRRASGASAMDTSFEGYYSAKLNPIGCGNCGETTAKLRQCTACKAIKYCGVDCQSEDWRRRHKKECKNMKAKKVRCEEIVRINLEKAAESQMGATSLFILGERLGVGDEQVPMEPELACKLYERAVTLQSPFPDGHPIAMLHLALHYERGIGVEQNQEKAHQYYKSVIEHSHPGEETLRAAFLALSRFHRDGLGGAEKSMTLAAKYLTMSKSNAESPREIKHLENWWEANGADLVDDDEVIGEVLRLEPRIN